IARAGSNPPGDSPPGDKPPAPAPPDPAGGRDGAPAPPAPPRARAAPPPRRERGPARARRLPPPDRRSRPARRSSRRPPSLRPSRCSLPGTVCVMRGGTPPGGAPFFPRHMEAADEDAFLRAVRSSRKLHRPWSYLPETPEDFRDMVVRPLGESYLICRNEDGALAGSASLGHIVFGNLRSAYLGYSALVPHQGQGYMTEGLELVLRHAFGTLALHRVEGNLRPANE